MSKWQATSQKEAAEFFGVEPRTVRNWRKQWEAEQQTWWLAELKARKSRPHYPLMEILRWLRTEGPWKPEKPDPAEGDGLLTAAAGTSPGLERYRLAKASLAEMDRDERQRHLMHVDQIREVYGRVGNAIRRALKVLKQRGDVLGHRTVQEALAEAGRIFNEAFATR